MSKHYAILFGVLAMGIAAQASAVSLSFQYDGTTTGTNPLTTTATAFYSNPGGINGTALNYTYAPTPTFSGGTGMVSTASGSINFTFTGTYTVSNLSGAILTFMNGTGAYAGYTGTGSLSHSFVAGNTVAGQFTASINPVPEPASILALSVGSVAMIRRRVRKAN